MTALERAGAEMKLPKWAQSELRNLRSQVARLTDELASHRGEAYSPWWSNDGLMEKPSLPAATCEVGYTDPDEKWAVSLNRRSDGEMLLWVNHAKMFAIIPQASNVVRIGIESHFTPGLR